MGKAMMGHPLSFWFGWLFFCLGVGGILAALAFNFLMQAEIRGVGTWRRMLMNRGVFTNPKQLNLSKEGRRYSRYSLICGGIAVIGMVVSRRLHVPLP